MSDRSAFKGSSYGYRVRSERALRRIAQERGRARIKEISSRTLRSWYEDWLADGKTSMAHYLMTQLRQVARYGAEVLDDGECAVLRDRLRGHRFPVAKPRTSIPTDAQVIAIRKTAHEFARPSIALVQALQFETGLSQQALIGEWIPPNGA